MTETTHPTTRGNEPARSRAVFSQEDFLLLKAAVAHYVKDTTESPDAAKYANLYHRLGRIS